MTRGKAAPEGRLTPGEGGLTPFEGATQPTLIFALAAKNGKLKIPAW